MKKRKTEIVEELVLLDRVIVLEEGDLHLVGCRCGECVQEQLLRDLRRGDFEKFEEEDIEVETFCHYHRWQIAPIFIPVRHDLLAITLRK